MSWKPGEFVRDKVNHRKLAFDHFEHDGIIPPRMAKDSPLLDVSEARQRLLAHFSPLEIVEVPLAHAVGRVLAESVSSPIALPPFDNSSMDGFAVRTSDLAVASPASPVELEVIADIPAGKTVEAEIGSGQAARIMTGAVMPPGADGVAPVEDTDFNYRQAGAQAPDSVRVYRKIRGGENIRPAGSDVKFGQALFAAGHCIRPQDAGLLSMIGAARLSVRRRPRVAVFSSGDELLPVEAELVAGKIHDANTYTLIGQVEQCGADAINLGIAPDQPQEIQALLDRAVAAEVDLILSSAGVSVGAMDFVRGIIEQSGRIEFWRVNMRPGKPFAFGYYQQKPFIGLPGNPVSAFVGFEVFVRPALLKMQGSTALNRSTMPVRLREEVESDGRESYLRAIVSVEGGEYVARLTGHQGSGNLNSLVQANALLLIPSGVKSVPSGGLAAAWLLEGSV